MKDVTYISANPFVNSQGRSLNEMSDYQSDWRATEIFKEIKNVWLTDWNKKTGTVHPRNLAQYIKDNINKRLIIHYIQPHAPYLKIGETVESSDLVLSRNRVIYDESKLPKKRKLIGKLKLLYNPVWKRLSKKRKMWLRKLFGIKIKMFWKFVVEGNIDTLKALYKENLKVSLNEVNEITKHLDGKVVVTSDHGEAFGENGEWEHPTGSNNPVLRTVPCLEVQGLGQGMSGSKDLIDDDMKVKEDEEEIKKKLEALGYKT